MAELLKGAPVASALTEITKHEAEKLRAQGIDPTLCILRVGEKPSDISYEKGAMKKAEVAGVRVINKVLREDVSQEAFDEVLNSINNDPEIHGILMMRPLPKQLDNEKARIMLNPEKDIDGCTDGSLAGVFTGNRFGFPPCTAEAVMKVLEFYEIDPAGKKACILGRSLVIGKPVSMMLLSKNATPVICHTKTANTEEIAKSSDILVCSVGKLHSVGTDFTNPNQTIIDVGINYDEAKGGISGDCDFEAVEPLVKAITPVPGGIGAVTSAVLINHVVEAAKRQNGIRL